LGICRKIYIEILCWKSSECILCAWRMYIGMRLWTHSSVHLSGCWKEEGLKTLDGRARNAGVSRNWSVLYVSYLEVTLAEGVYKLYVVYRRQEKRQRSGIFGAEAGSRDDGCNNQRCRKLLLLPSVYPYDSTANQRISSSGSLSTVVRLSAWSGSHPFPSVSQQQRARSQPTQRLTNRWRLSATRVEFRKVVFSILYRLFPPPPLSLFLFLSQCFKLNYINAWPTDLISLRCPDVLNITFLTFSSFLSVYRFSI